MENFLKIICVWLVTCLYCYCECMNQAISRKTTFIVPYNKPLAESQIAQEWQKAFNGKKPLYTITVTRSGASVLLKSERYFVEKILEFLLSGRNSFNEYHFQQLFFNDTEKLKQIKSGNPRNMSPYEKSLYNKQYLNLSNGGTILINLNKRIAQNKKLQFLRNNHAIIIFNEMFFGKNSPFCEEEAECLKSEFNELSIAFSNKAFYVNWLNIKHREVTQQIADGIKEKIAERRERENDFSFESKFDVGDDDFNYENYKESIQSQIGNTVPTLENVTFLFINGRNIISYNKSTYYQECDDLIETKVPYVFGNGKDTILIDNPISQVFHSNVSTEICRDLVCSIKNFSLKEKVHIFQSNTLALNSLLFSRFHDKVHAIIHSDPNLSSSSSVFLGRGDFYSLKVMHNLSNKTDSTYNIAWQNSGTLIDTFKFTFGESEYSIYIRDIARELEE